jgi:hypothetical protein
VYTQGRRARASGASTHAACAHRGSARTQGAARAHKRRALTQAARKHTTDCTRADSQTSRARTHVGAGRAGGGDEGQRGDVVAGLVADDVLRVCVRGAVRRESEKAERKAGQGERGDGGIYTHRYVWKEIGEGGRGVCVWDRKGSRCC